jgi:hypothetical protein
MIVDNVAGPSPFTNDPRRHRIVENCLSLPPDFRRTHLLPDKQTANVLVNSYFTNVSENTPLPYIAYLTVRRSVGLLKSSIAKHL